eukprot:GHVU01030330.1.p1 GENE.GHVU01030330.1~~GHVU01030330.1.p1  ORF type:complete len:104 (-),score=1.88 GHVU01030330.1:206-517(-)
MCVYMYVCVCLCVCVCVCVHECVWNHPRVPACVSHLGLYLFGIGFMGWRLFESPFGRSASSVSQSVGVVGVVVVVGVEGRLRTATTQNRIIAVGPSARARASE